jgi:hypothetical protein
LLDVNPQSPTYGRYDIATTDRNTGVVTWQAQDARGNFSTTNTVQPGQGIAATADGPEVSLHPSGIAGTPTAFVSGTNAVLVNPYNPQVTTTGQAAANGSGTMQISGGRPVFNPAVTGAAPAGNGYESSGGDFGTTGTGTYESNGGDFGTTGTSATQSSGGDFGPTATSATQSSGGDFGPTDTNTTQSSGGDFGPTETSTSSGGDFLVDPK